MRDNFEVVPRASDQSISSRVSTSSQGTGKSQSAQHWLGLVLSALGFVVRQRFAFICVLALGIVFIVALLMIIPKTYQADSRILIVAANVGRDPSVTSIDLPSLATSSVLLRQVEQKLHLSLDLVDFKQRVRASVKARSSVMEIDYRDKVAERAVTVSNAIADELVLYYDSISSRGSDVTIRKLDRAIADVQHRLRTIDDAATRQMKLHPFVQSDKALDGVTLRIDELTGQKKLALAALALDIAQRNAISGDPVIEHKTVRYEKLQNDPVYRELASNIAKDAVELAVDRMTLTEQHPTVRDLEKRLKSERIMSSVRVHSTLSSGVAFSSTEANSALELRKANAAITGDRARIDEINALTGDANDRLHDTLNAGVLSERLRLQHDAAKADYLALTARRAAAIASRAEALSLGSLVVVDRAVRSDTTVVGLGTKSLAFAMALFVFASAAFVAFAIDAFDPRINRAGQIEKLYGVPLIALIEVDS